MKRIEISMGLLIATLALLLSSCKTPLQQQTEELGISTSGTYEGSAKIYFDFKTKADTLVRYTFGPNPIEVHSHIVKVPLRVIGDKADRPRSYRVKVIEEKTTAKSGVHYTPLEQTYQFRAGEYTDTLRIELLRDALSPDEPKADSLTISLVGTEDLSIAFPATNQFTVTFENYLAEPMYWNGYGYGPMFLGSYNRVKYIKLLEAFDNNEEKFWNGIMDWTNWILNVKNVRDYFIAHPEYGINDIPDPSAMIPFIE